MTLRPSELVIRILPPTLPRARSTCTASTSKLRNVNMNSNSLHIYISTFRVFNWRQASVNTTFVCLSRFTQVFQLRYAHPHTRDRARSQAFITSYVERPSSRSARCTTTLSRRPADYVYQRSSRPYHQCARPCRPAMDHGQGPVCSTPVWSNAYWRSWLWNPDLGRP